MLLDALGDFEDMPSWEEAADHLFNGGFTLNPSALHGALVGLLGAGFRPSSDQQIDALVAALEKALSLEFNGAFMGFVTRLSLATASSIDDADYTFQPLMPDDDNALEERLLSVSEWSKGFLAGFTQGISIREAAGKPVPSLTAEALKDFAEIAQVEIDVPESEEADRQLEEITEYLRFAAINIVMETRIEQEDLSENN